MQKLAEICIRRPVFGSVLILILLVFGVFGYQKLGLDRFPKVDAPNITITTSYPGAAPEEIESDITDKIEEAVNTISGIDELRSVSSEGNSQVTVSFVLEKDADTAAQEVRDKVNGVLNQLPEGVDQPVISKVDPDAQAILTIALSGPPPLKNITEYADKVLRRRIEPVSGVGQVTVVGGQARQINVRVNPERLRAYNLTASDVQNAISAHNTQTPGGNLETGLMNYSMRTKGRVGGVEEIAVIPVLNKSNHSVTVGNVATVQDGVAEPTSIARLNGQDAVLLSVRKQSGTNTVAMVDEVKSRLEELRKTLPAGYQMEYVSDQSQYIRASTGAVKEHLVLGSLLAAVVVLMFLRNWRGTIISAIAIPTSVISTFALIWAMGYTLNEITLLALTLSVGIVIDDAIVVLENIFRFMEEKGLSPLDAAREATGEIGLAVMVITFSLIAVFLPIAFMSGMVGRFMGAFGMTMSFAIAISLFVSFTLTPSLASRWLKVHGKRGSQESSGKELESSVSTKSTGLYGLLDRAYLSILRWSMTHRWVVVLACLAALGTIPVLFARVDKNFLPEDDQSELGVDIRLREGASLTATQEVADRLAADLMRMNGVKYTLVSIGEGTGAATNKANLEIHLIDPSRRIFSQKEAVEFVRDTILPKYAKELTRSSVSGASGIGKGDGPSGAQYVIRGPSLDKLIAYSSEMVSRLKNAPGIVDVQSSLELGKPEYGITINREKAADLGVSVTDIASTLRMLVAGQKVSDYAENGEQYEVNLRASTSARSSLEGLSLVSVPSTKHGAVLLRDVVNYERESGPSEINRLARQRQVTISSNIANGYSQEQAIQQMEKVAKEMNMGSEYTTGLSGMSKEMGKAAGNFIVAFLTAFIFMYLVIAAQFESWLHPFTILLSLPLTLPFALLSQILFGQSLNMFSALGMLVLFAVVKKNSILQIDHTLQLRARGLTRLEAILAANRDRLRPILMTTIAFVAGMLPMLFAHGAGSGTTRSISSLIVGGQTMSLMLTLLATPVAYSLFDDLAEKQVVRRIARVVVMPARLLHRVFSRTA